MSRSPQGNRRVLALFRLGRVDEATRALAEAVSTLPIVAEEIVLLK